MSQYITGGVYSKEGGQLWLLSRPLERLANFSDELIEGRGSVRVEE